MKTIKVKCMMTDRASNLSKDLDTGKYTLYINKSTTLKTYDKLYKKVIDIIQAQNQSTEYKIDFVL